MMLEIKHCMYHLKFIKDCKCIGLFRQTVPCQSCKNFLAFVRKSDFSGAYKEIVFLINCKLWNSKYLFIKLVFKLFNVLNTSNASKVFYVHVRIFLTKVFQEFNILFSN